MLRQQEKEILQHTFPARQTRNNDLFGKFSFFHNMATQTIIASVKSCQFLYHEEI